MPNCLPKKSSTTLYQWQHMRIPAYPHPHQLCNLSVLETDQFDERKSVSSDEVSSSSSNCERDRRYSMCGLFSFPAFSRYGPPCSSWQWRWPRAQRKEYWVQFPLSEFPAENLRFYSQILAGFPEGQIPEAASETWGLVFCCPSAILVPTHRSLLSPALAVSFLWDFPWLFCKISLLVETLSLFYGGAESFSFMRFCCSSELKIPHWSCYLLVASYPGSNTATGLCDGYISSATLVGFK